MKFIVLSAALALLASTAHASRSPHTPGCTGVYVALDGSCVDACPSGRQSQSNSQQCICPEGEFISYDNTCVTSCTDVGLQLSQDEENCVMPDDFSCPDGTTKVSLHDTLGDGWNGNELMLVKSNSEKIYLTLLCPSGSYTCFSTPAQCFADVVEIKYSIATLAYYRDETYFKVDGTVYSYENVNSKVSSASKQDPILLATDPICIAPWSLNTDTGACEECFGYVMAGECVSECPSDNFISVTGRKCLTECPNYISSASNQCVDACNADEYTRTNGKKCKRVDQLCENAVSSDCPKCEFTDQQFFEELKTKVSCL